MPDGQSLSPDQAQQCLQSADLHRILCSLDRAILWVGADLNLRFANTAARRMLGIGPHSVGSALPIIGRFGLAGHISGVLAHGIATGGTLSMRAGAPLTFRVMPLHRFGAADQIRDGVVITFEPTDAHAAPTAPKVKPVQPIVTDGGLAAGYPDLGCGLTTRQHQVLSHVLAGHPSKIIAADLGISRRTVENHRAAIMARTGATSLPALARLAIGADVGGDCRTASAHRICSPGSATNATRHPHPV